MVDDLNRPYQLYFTPNPLESPIAQIPSIEHSPKVLVFPNQIDNIIIEESID